MRRAPAIAACVSLLFCVSCSTKTGSTGKQNTPVNVDPPAAELPFDVHWPLVDPGTEKAAETTALLKGKVAIRTEAWDTTDPRMVIRLTLTRPDNEEHRRFWNSCLAYYEYQWMDNVRVWDRDRRWLYPNLPFLFQLHGVDRIDRYGGWDPGKDVDNDFGAVLLRKYDATGREEHPHTSCGPLVSAAWHPVGHAGGDRYAVVHGAASDEFTLHLLENGAAGSGRVKLWFVYGDFMNHRVPDSWPDEPEFDGGTMAFFHIDWQYKLGKPFRPIISQQTPEHTGFDWPTWIGREEESTQAVGKPRLMDRYQ
jgi:hypothetical protein